MIDIDKCEDVWYRWHWSDRENITKDLNITDEEFDNMIDIYNDYLKTKIQEK